MTPPTTSINPLLVELICRQLIDVTSPDQDVCAVTRDPDDASLWVHLVNPAATMSAGTGLASYGLVVEATGVDTLHISGWSPRLLPGRRQRAKQWIARLRTSQVQAPDSGTEKAALRSFSDGGAFPGESASLIDAIDAAAETYQRLLDERIAFAEYMLTVYLTALHSRYATVADSEASPSLERGADGRTSTAFERTSGVRAVA